MLKTKGRTHVAKLRVYEEFYRQHERIILSISLVALNANLDFQTRLEIANYIAKPKNYNFQK